MDCVRTGLAGPYRVLVALRSALPGFTRTMAPRSIRQASSRQANTTELTSRGPRTVSRMDRAGCAVLCGLPWYSRGAQNCCSVCSARKPPARAGAESSDCRRMEHGKQCACVSQVLTSSGEPCSFVAAARQNLARLAARLGQAIATHTARQRTFKF
jgi:hypothetical protein